MAWACCKRERHMDRKIIKIIYVEGIIEKTKINGECIESDLKWTDVSKEDVGDCVR